jgi:hypothetical protein
MSFNGLSGDSAAFAPQQAQGQGQGGKKKKLQGEDGEKKVCLL